MSGLSGIPFRVNCTFMRQMIRRLSNFGSKTNQFDIDIFTVFIYCNERKMNFLGSVVPERDAEAVSVVVGRVHRLGQHFLAKIRFSENRQNL